MYNACKSNVVGCAEQQQKKWCSSIDRECVVPENIHTRTTEDSLICTPPPPRIFRSRGSLLTPLPQEFPEFLNGDFAYHPLEIQSGFGTFKTKKVNTNSVSYENTVESYYHSAV